MKSSFALHTIHAYRHTCIRTCMYAYPYTQTYVGTHTYISMYRYILYIMKLNLSDKLGCLLAMYTYIWYVLFFLQRQHHCTTRLFVYPAFKRYRMILKFVIRQGDQMLLCGKKSPKRNTNHLYIFCQI
jgi:hypothetical protein